MLTHRSFRALVPLGLGFVLLIASAVAAIWLSARQEAAVAWVSHTLEVENRINLITTKPMGQGTGLGLSMIYGFAQQSEGYAKIYSEVGKGTTFKIYLPRYRGAEVQDDVGAVLNAPRASDAGEVVLVVEDESVVRGLIVEELRGLGYVTLEATDGPKGLEVLRSQRHIDLLVTDIGLQG